MANQIRLKRGSGSDPSASDLATGEIAVRTDNGKLFTKKDDGSVAEISGGGGVSDGDKGDITVSNSGATFTIDSGVIDNANVASDAAIAGSKISPTFTADVVINNSEPKLKLTDSDNNSDFILLNSHGNFRIFDETNSAERFKIDSSGTGTFSGNLNIGSGGDIDVAGNIIVGGTVDGRNVASDGTKLDGIESNATADQTAAEIKTLLNSNQLETAQIANNAITADKISNSTVTFSKLQNVSQNRIVGRVSSGSGVLQELTAANIRSIINVEDGATGDQTASDIRGLGFFDTSNDGSGSGLDADLLDGVHAGGFLSSENADTADGDITFNGGAGAATVAAGSDIRFTNGNWTGNSCKIQHHSDYLYIQSGSNGHIFRNSNGNNRWLITASGNFEPDADSTYNIGSNSVRVANGYFDTLYGDGSNLTGVSASDNTKLPLSGGELTGDLITHEVRPDSNNSRSLGTALLRWSEVFTNDLHLSNEGSSNSVDGTWGDWTIQEGEDKVFMLNNRNGKKYAINLTEIV